MTRRPRKGAVLSRVGGCATKHKAFTGSVVGLPFDSVARRCWDATNNFLHLSFFCPIIAPSEVALCQALSGQINPSQFRWGMCSSVVWSLLSRDKSLIGYD